MKQLTWSKLRDILSYNKDTGEFVLLKTGDAISGTDNGKGYVYISIDGKKYYLHRLAWFYVKGRWPIEIDHKDGVRANNVWANLRECSRTGNLQNLHVVRNPSKLMGVSYCKRWKCYKAQIGINNRQKWLGYFETAELAHDAYLKAKTVYHLEK